MKLSTLIGCRVHLQLMELEDLDEVYALQSQPGKIAQGAIVRTYERMKSDIIKWSDNPYGMYTIRDYDTDKIIGTGGFEEVDPRYELGPEFKGKVETCFLRIDDAYQGQGYASEARECLFDYMLSDHTGVEEVYSFTLNPAIKHLNEKMGFTLVDDKVKFKFAEGESADADVIAAYRLTKENWWQARQKLPVHRYGHDHTPIESRSASCVTL